MKTSTDVLGDELLGACERPGLPVGGWRWMVLVVSGGPVLALACGLVLVLVLLWLLLGG